MGKKISARSIKIKFNGKSNGQLDKWEWRFFDKFDWRLEEGRAPLKKIWLKDRIKLKTFTWIQIVLHCLLK